MVKITTDFRVLLQLAGAQARAEKSGNAEEIEKAKREHDSYKELCLRADEMITGLITGDV